MKETILTDLNYKYQDVFLSLENWILFTFMLVTKIYNVYVMDCNLT